MAFLEINSIDAGYDEVRILHEVSLKLEEGDFLAIAGPNGSGKSTLLKAIVGEIIPTTGNVLYKQQDVTKMKPHQKADIGIGYLPQVDNVFPDLTVEENLQMGGYLFGEEKLKEGILRAYDQFPALADKRKVESKFLSGGQRRMLAIASTLVIQPICLLLDEPTSDLAVSIVHELFESIRKIHEESRTTIILVEQNVHYALDAAQRIIMLARGRKVRDCSTADISDDELGEVMIAG